MSHTARRLSTTVYLEERQYEELRRLSAATRVPQAALIRDGVDAAIEKWRAIVEKHPELYGGKQ